MNHSIMAMLYTFPFVVCRSDLFACDHHDITNTNKAIHLRSCSKQIVDIVLWIENSHLKLRTQLLIDE